MMSFGWFQIEASREGSLFSFGMVMDNRKTMVG